MNKNTFLGPVIFWLLFSLIACEPVEQTKLIKKEVLAGFAQKGPFITGSSVTVSELDSAFHQTGRVYSTTTDGSAGRFELKNVELISPYVLLRADGYYFNEISGVVSAGTLTLYTLADIRDVNSVNINVLTHLERGRVEYLIAEQKMSFSQAKRQAQTEVLNIFNLSIENDSVSESIVIHGKTVNDAVLLAVSCILQGTLSTAEMTELMSKIIADIKTDGVLNDLSLGSALIDNARLINRAQIRSNLEKQYSGSDSLQAQIPDFEKYISDFIANTAYTPVKVIGYPAQGNSGPNVLHDTVSVVNIGRNYSLKADLPAGTSLKVHIKNGLWHYVALPAPLNWTASVYNGAEKSQVFTVNEATKNNDLTIMFSSKGVITLEYYENQAVTPTKTKTITVRDSTVTAPVGSFSFPYWSDYMQYYNILSDSLKTTYGGKVYSMRALIPSGRSMKIVLSSNSQAWVPEADGKNDGWLVSPYNATAKSQTFTSTKAVCDMGIVITGGRVTVEFYEDSGSKLTHVKYLN